METTADLLQASDILESLIDQYATAEQKLEDKIKERELDEQALMGAHDILDFDDIATNFLNKHLKIQKQLSRKDSEFRLELLNKMESSAHFRLTQEHRKGQLDILEEFRVVFEHDLQCVENILFHEFAHRDKLVDDYIADLENIKKPVIVVPRKCAVCYEIVNDYFYCSNGHPEGCCTTCALSSYLSHKQFNCPLCAKAYSDKEFKESIVRTCYGGGTIPIELTEKDKVTLHWDENDDTFNHWYSNLDYLLPFNM